jgi:glycosyltransferase involved in cell wall biosynthesis
MLGSLSKKIKTKLGISVNSWEQDSWTPYRFFQFVTSQRGQQKLLFFGKKVFFGIARRATGRDFTPNNNYKKWRKLHVASNKELTRQRETWNSLTVQPKFSLVLPTYNPQLNHLQQVVESVQAQTYGNWELLISDDCSTNDKVISFLETLKDKPEITVLFHSENGHISKNTNRGITQATGEFIVFIDHDDTLDPEALYQYALALNANPSIDVLYCDEDKIDDHGKMSNPYFKPDWSPETLLSRNYICHLLAVRKTLVDQVGGLREGFEGAQDYDFLLRITALTAHIHHVPKVLYHWRMHQASTAQNSDSKSYYKDAGVRALNEAIQAEVIQATARSKNHLPGFYYLDFDLSQFTQKVSIIIPSKNLADVTQTCIQSIFEKTDYANFEVILMNNNSDEDSFFELVNYWENKEPNRFTCITDNGDFNFSRLMNKSVEASIGEYIVLLNNDTEVLDGNWLTQMMGWAKQDAIGAVGVKLLFPNDTIQHAGVVMGLNGIAGHFLNCQYKEADIFWHTLNGTTNYSAVTAACLMVTKSKFLEVGGFDEELAVEFNDVDFCLKLRKAGYRNVYTPEVVLYHYESISRGHPHKTKESYQRHLREIGLFKQRWEKEIISDPYYNTHLSRIHSDAKLRVKEELIL